MLIEEVILSTSSLTKTKQFYTKTLELALVKETDESLSFRVGKSVLTFRTLSGAKPFYHIAFNITNNRFSDSFEWMNKKLDILPMENGLPIAVYDNWNAESFYFHDNNGNILEFIVRFDLPYHSNDPFSIDDIREISEVGIVADNVTATVANLQKEHSIPYFSKSKPSEHFTVLGDDHGLLIVTSKGRGWIPTNRPAAIFPITIISGKTRIEL